LALPFGYYATRQVVRKFNQLDKKREEAVDAEEVVEIGVESKVQGSSKVCGD
jgi:hypothetical protein